MRYLVACAVVATLLMPGIALADQNCTKQGRSYPEGTAFRTTEPCAGLRCRVYQCRNGKWSRPDRVCTLDGDCPPVMPR